LNSPIAAGVQAAQNHALFAVWSLLQQENCCSWQHPTNSHHSFNPDAPCLQVGEADDGAGGKIYINKYEAKLAETEDEAAYQTMMLEPKIPVVINENKLNGFGSARGYKVQLNRPLLNLEPPGYARSKALGENGEPECGGAWLCVSCCMVIAWWLQAAVQGDVELLSDICHCCV
jgi:hypothetical protein